jgi:hypothetical protein
VEETSSILFLGAFLSIDLEAIFTACICFASMLIPGTLAHPFEP